MDYLKQSELNSIFAYANYSNGYQSQIGTMPEENGSVLIAGVEKEDLADGYFHLKLDYANAGTITNRPSHFVFVNPDTQYLSISTDTTKLTESSQVKTVITANNVQDLVKGQFTLKNTGNATLKIKSIVPTEALKKMIGVDDITINHSQELVNKYTQEFNLSFALPENTKGLTGDVALFDVVFEVEEFRGVAEDLMDDVQFLYTTLAGEEGSFENAKGEALDVKTGTLVHSFDLESVDRTLIYGTVDLPVRGLEGGKLVAIDPAGNEYEPTYAKLDDWTQGSYLFAFNDLPVIEGDYTILYKLPGAFDSVIKVPGSKTNEAGKQVGNLFGVMRYTFSGTTALYPVLGDVNGDGAIDIIDAHLIGQEYQAEIPQTLSVDSSAADITQDGVVNYDDMYLVLYNYLSKDLTRSDAATPQEYYNGNDIYDILEACGYFDEQPENNVTLGLSSEVSTVGDRVTLTATPPVDGIEFEYEFSVREANDLEWTVIREKADGNEVVWIPEVAGEYSVKVRIFYDEIDYVWQDNKAHTVHKKPAVIPSELQGQLDTSYLLPVEGDGTKESPLVIEVNSDVNDEKAKEALETLFAGYEIKVELKDGLYNVNLIKQEVSHFLTFNIAESKQEVIAYLNSLITAEPTKPDQPVDPDQPTKPDQPVDPDQPTEPDQPVDPDQSTNPDQPTNPTDQTNPEKPVNKDIVTGFTGGLTLLALGGVLVAVGANTRKKRK